MKQQTLHSVETLSKELSVDSKRFGQPASEDDVKRTVRALEMNNLRVIVVDDANAALEALKKAIPSGATIMDGTSTTLVEIGFVDYLKNPDIPWENQHAAILAENDPSKQADLRRKAGLADYFVSSAQAITQNGEIVGCDASGSRVGAWLFTAKNVVIVAGTNKIVPDLSAALARVHEYAFPLENVRAKIVYGMGSNVSKIAVLGKEFGPRTTVILVKEALGY